VAVHVEPAFWQPYLVTVASGGRTETRRGEMVVADAPSTGSVAVPLRHGPADTVGVLLEHRSEQITIVCARAAG
jgi:hypothetical protein